MREEAKGLEASLIDFFEGAWPEIDPAPLKLSWHHEAIAEHLEATARGSIRKLLINVPPRHTKSLMCSVAFPAWIWAQQFDPEFPIMGPQASFFCLSYGNDLALDHALLMKRLIQSRWYRSRWGRRVTISEDKEATDKFDTTAKGTRMSGSMDGTSTGRGADYRIFDDPHNIRRIESDHMRKTTTDTYDQVMKNRVTDPKTSVEIIVMQRSHEGDLSGHVLAKDAGYTHLMLPAEFEPDRHCLTYVGGEPFWADPRTKKGELLWPDQWGTGELKTFKDNEYTWCTPSESPVLMADLSMKPIGTIDVGDAIIGFTTDTAPRPSNKDAYARRRLVPAKVLSISKSMQPVVKILLDSGETIRCTADHKWYNGGKNAHPLYLPPKVGRKLCRVCPPTIQKLETEEEIRAAGWLAGFFDGEGSVTLTKKKGGYPPSALVTFAQGAGRNLPLCERLERELTRFGFDYGYQEHLRQDRKTGRDRAHKSRLYYLRNGGHALPTHQRFLHVIRPNKWRERMIQGALGTAFVTGREAILSITPDGEEAVYGLETTTGNYVVWGLASSNSGQYQQRPSPAGGGIIKREWWNLWGDEDDPLLEKPENARFRKHPNYTMKIGVLDTAYTEKQQNDPSAMAVWGLWANDRGIPQVMLASAWHERLLFPDLIAKVVETARRMSIDVLLVEDKTAGPPIVQELQRYYSDESWQVELVPINRSSGDKAARLTSVSPSFNQGQIWSPNKKWANDFIDIVAMFPNAIHDEQADLTSMGIGYFRKRGLLDTEAEIRHHEDQKRNKRGRERPLYPGTSRR